MQGLVVSIGCGADVPLPTASQWSPPSTVPVTAFVLLALAANTSSLVMPFRPELFSYQTTHGTVSPGPVSAMSGSTRLVDVERRVHTLPLDPDLLPAEPPLGSFAKGVERSLGLTPVQFAAEYEPASRTKI